MYIPNFTLKNPREIFHITDVMNLPSITRRDLLSTAAMYATAINHHTIAHQSIQDRRARTLVTCGPKGNLHDYVPFHFGPRPPMLLSTAYRGWNKKGRGQEQVVHLISSVGKVSSANLPFVFSDGHAIMHPRAFYDDLRYLNMIDWPVMRLLYWRSQSDPDLCRRRNAEFLVHSSFPWELVEEIAVFDDTMATTVRGIIASLPHQPPVSIRQGWYY